MKKGCDSSVEMFVKLVGLSSEVVTPLEKAIRDGVFKTSREYDDCDNIYRLVGSLVEILSCKRDSANQTYTIELKIVVKCHRAMTKGDAPLKFGEYFTSASVLSRLFFILSLGQQAPLFPETETLVEDEKGD